MRTSLRGFYVFSRFLNQLIIAIKNCFRKKASTEPVRVSAFCSWRRATLTSIAVTNHSTEEELQEQLCFTHEEVCHAVLTALANQCTKEMHLDGSFFKVEIKVERATMMTARSFFSSQPFNNRNKCLYI